MKISKSFNNRQYQLPVCRNKKEKRRSLKSRKINDLFIGKIAYNPMLLRNNCRYDIENRNDIRQQIKLLRELLEQHSA